MKNEEKAIKILLIVPNLRAAGIETSIVNNYKYIDKSKIHFDFIVHNQNKNFYDDELEKMGSKIYRFTFKDDKNIFKYINDLNKFFKEHKEYKILHGEMQSMMPLYLKIAKKNGVPIRIAHAHNSDFEKSLKGVILHLFSKFTKNYSNVNFACSNNSGHYLFNNKNFDVLYNGIDISNFSYDSKIRDNMRKKLNISENTIVYGHVGRFEKQKNHEQLIRIFKKLHDKNENSILILIGSGKKKKKIEKLVNKLNLDKFVKFLGERKDVNDLYQAMDVFLLPSLYEGLPMVGVEAQLCNLPCIFSSTITKELKISNFAYFIDYNDIQQWEETIDKILSNFNRNDVIVDRKKFDIRNTSLELQEKYIHLYNGGEKI